MKSPFPGMDPFIEGCGLWGDFSHHLVCSISRTLNEVLPERYVARINCREYYEDVQIRNALVSQEFRELYISILDFDDDSRQVTRIEVLSPTNKRLHSIGREWYARERHELLNGNTANLVEIDLLRNGQRMGMSEFWPSSPYTIMVARKSNLPMQYVLPAYFHKPLPFISIPLLDTDSDALLDLQPMIREVYAVAHYERSIDYTKPLKPALGESELAWLQERLQGRE